MSTEVNDCPALGETGTIEDIRNWAVTAVAYAEQRGEKLPGDALLDAVKARHAWPATVEDIGLQPTLALAVLALQRANDLTASDTLNAIMHLVLLPKSLRELVEYKSSPAGFQFQHVGFQFRHVGGEYMDPVQLAKEGMSWPISTFDQEEEEEMELDLTERELDLGVDAIKAKLKALQVATDVEPIKASLRNAVEIQGWVPAADMHVVGLDDVGDVVFCSNQGGLAIMGSSGARELCFWLRQNGFEGGKVTDKDEEIANLRATKRALIKAGVSLEDQVAERDETIRVMRSALEYTRKRIMPSMFGTPDAEANEWLVKVATALNTNNGGDDGNE